ncbi:hypothetical protein SEVIR_3G280600v4 [Setaria viridis]|uniref:Uncharacterized protein n=1 Tax=Setaria viridis TaxID=4556 RepID=A0A4V6D9X9_SETVI|nr:uncharacterized protein LOC117847604 [Setaria viridis]TKW27786.1 hypothetical protein SEVIR_3G280600v2 [Setaria viridis]
MGKKRAAAVGAAAAPVFPFPASAAGEPDHFSDYGFDPQLVGFFPQREAKRPSSSSRRHQPPPLESARFKLQKPISKKHHHHLQKQQQQPRRRHRWWSSAASAALLLFKRPSSSDSSSSAAAPAPPHYGYSASATVPLYLAGDDSGADDGPAACTCWAPAMRSGRLAAAELGAAADAVPYVSLRSASLGGGGAGAGRAGGGAPAMPIYLVT